MKCEIRDSCFDPWEELRHFQDHELGHKAKYGATASFVGTMRDVNAGNIVEVMTLEHYPGMTDKHLREISEKAKQQWDILDTLIIHRVGELRPNDPIVLIAVWSAHRAAAFDACRFLIEELKSRAPFWKKETLDKEVRWVRQNTPAD
ncbi:MAG: molybdenum cofactor biosynthesis protein MoaE [Acidiferrobacterales bacterium]|nr:molybdenum cofactor biosynthesis protein MoaE [Gammaproteobacteria bacterium]